MMWMKLSEMKTSISKETPGEVMTIIRVGRQEEECKQ